jgi:hypothetical protein
MPHTPDPLDVAIASQRRSRMRTVTPAEIDGTDDLAKEISEKQRGLNVLLDQLPAGARKQLVRVMLEEMKAITVSYLNLASLPLADPDGHSVNAPRSPAGQAAWSRRVELCIRAVEQSQH